MRTRLLLLATIVVAAAAGPASGQAARPESLSYMSKLFHVNGFGVPDNPRYTRDGRWLAFDARDNGAERIFVMAANGGTPIAITTGTHKDVRPMWTAAGDRLVFHSAQTGGVMTIAIDPATGRAIGSVKRVTIDSVFPGGFDVAPDGQRVAYLTATGPNRVDLRTVSINGGPSNTLATVEGGGSTLRFDRAGTHIYFLVQRLEGKPQKGNRARDVRRISTTGGAVSTVFTIPEGLMGGQLDPIADRVLVRDGDRAHVLTLAGDSVATIAWAQGFRTASHLGFTPDGSSIVTSLDATRTSIHVVPLDGGPIRAITDGSGYPWPDYWVGDHIFITGETRGARDDMLAMDGKVTAIDPDLRKANDGVPLKVVAADPFADGIHHAVKGIDAARDTSLFVYNDRTGEVRRVAQKVTGTRGVSANGVGDSYSARFENGFLYRNVKNGIVDVHLADVSGSDRAMLSVPMLKSRQTIAFGPGRVAHGYERGDTAFLDVTIGSGNAVHALVRPGARMGEIVFNADGSSLYADVVTGSGANARTSGGFFSTVDAKSLSRPARWIDTGDCWHPTWLPSGVGVLEFCDNEAGTRTWVSRLPATGSAVPQPMTQRETAVFWDYTMSPDGKSVAVPAESNSGSNLWRVDLRAAAKAKGLP